MPDLGPIDILAPALVAPGGVLYALILIIVAMCYCAHRSILWFMNRKH